MANQVLADAWEQREDDDVVVQSEVGGHGLRVVRLQHAVAVVGYVDARLGQVRIVERLEGVELLGALFRRAVAAQQPGVEVDAHLGHHGSPLLVLCRSYLDGRNQVLLAVRPQLADGQLRAGEDDGLRQVLQHVAQRRCRVGHRVRAVQHHEAVVAVVVVGYHVAQVSPPCRRHVARVDGRLKLVGIYLYVKLFQLRHVVQQVLEVERFQCPRGRVAVHADGAAGVDE